METIIYNVKTTIKWNKTFALYTIFRFFETYTLINNQNENNKYLIS